jgi:hypothetical protein
MRADRQGIERVRRRLHRATCILARLIQAFDLGFEARETRRAFGDSARGKRRLALCRQQIVLALAQFARCSTHRFHRRRVFGLCRLMLGVCPIAQTSSELHLLFERLEQIALLQSRGGLARRVRRCGVTVPTPHIAALRHQPLSRHQILLEALAVLDADDTRQRKAPAERDRRIDERRKRGARGQGGRRLKITEMPPVMRCRLVERCVQLIANAAASAASYPGCTFSESISGGHRSFSRGRSRFASALASAVNRRVSCSA